MLHISRLADDHIKTPVIFFNKPVVQHRHFGLLAVNAYYTCFPCNKFYVAAKPVFKNGKIYVQMIGGRKNNIRLKIVNHFFYGKQRKQHPVFLQLNNFNCRVFNFNKRIGIINHHQANRKYTGIDMPAKQ